ncbi:hypothetical protein GCM10023157_06680 [Gluconacetobacter asukensis]
MQRQPADDGVKVAVFAAQFVQLAEHGIPVSQHCTPSGMWSAAHSIDSRSDGEIPDSAHGRPDESCNFSMRRVGTAGLGCLVSETQTRWRHHVPRTQNS